ncbi:hypothetical protein Baya_9231 [Bagarius yarrelli]|uniref:Uncharacterized protein n=1 Tax=Bagarius yarrelli TaxID=175774 RepID=A0A556U6C7_BAGYA|nr:hypothetical protein Baya_9231 [Bagarius yarrelli]
MEAADEGRKKERKEEGEINKFRTEGGVYHCVQEREGGGVAQVRVGRGKGSGEHDTHTHTMTDLLTPLQTLEDG